MSAAGGVDPFDFGERTGLLLISLAAGLSAVSVLGCLVYIVWVVVPNIRNRKPGHAGLYFFSLLIADLVQAIGSLMNLKWVVQAKITDGPFCIAQGAMKQGDVAVAFSTMAIAIDTFAVLFFRWKHPKSLFIPIIVTITIWVFYILAITIPSVLERDPFGRHNYYGNTSYWCWIKSSYEGERIGLEYLWMWSCAFLNVFLYITLFFRLRGNIVVKGFRISFKRLGRDKAWPEDQDDYVSNQARKMLWYPFIYILSIVPIGVVRWTVFSNGDDKVPFAATTTAGILFNLSGFFNVVLFTWSRPGLLPDRSKGGSDEEAAGDDDYLRSLRRSPIAAVGSRGPAMSLRTGSVLERTYTEGSWVSDAPSQRPPLGPVHSNSLESQRPLTTASPRRVAFEPQRQPRVDLLT